MLHLAHNFVWCWNLDGSENRSEIPGKFLNVMLEKDEGEQMDRPCEKWSVTKGQEERNFLHSYTKEV